jgi:ABC-type multidrug transport system fused ATPase/permease subunit
MAVDELRGSDWAQAPRPFKRVAIAWIVLASLGAVIAMVTLDDAAFSLILNALIPLVLVALLRIASRGRALQ